MCKFKLNKTVYDRSNHFGKGKVTFINEEDKIITVEFEDDNNQQYTTSGRRIAQEATLQLEEETSLFKVGDIVEDTTRKFGRGVVTQVDPDYMAIAVKVQFDNNPTPQSYTADGRFYTSEPQTLTLVKRPFTLEVGDYVAEPDCIAWGIGKVIAITEDDLPVKINFPKRKHPTTSYTLDGRFTEDADPTLVLIRRDK